MLLLSLLPSIGRVAGSGPAGIAARPLVAVCTVLGMKLVDPANFGSTDLAQKPDPNAPMHPGEDCDYCPLLATALLAFVAIAFALLRFGQPDAPEWRSLRFASFRYPSGLGSRGPPILL